MQNSLSQFEALQAAVRVAGSQSELARICGLSQPAVWKWLQSSKRVPAEYVLRIEARTGVSRHHLRPDIYPSPVAIDQALQTLAPAEAQVRCHRSLEAQSAGAPS